MRTRPPPVDAPPIVRELVVEDDSEHAASLVERLRDAGYEVDHAADGGEAVRKTASTEPEVVLIDLGLPIIDGWEAIGRIRRLGRSPRPYIVAMSGYTDARSRQRAFDAGCNEYVIKPLDVLGVLRAFVHRRRLALRGAR